MEKRHQIKRYASMLLMALFVVATVSCERDLFWVSDTSFDLKPVKLTIGFELPELNSVATTRELSPMDEHQLNNFYLMIFQNNPADPGSSKLIKRKLFYPYELADKSDFIGEEETWMSIEVKYNEDFTEGEVDKINSTNGYVVLDDVEIDTSKGIYVFGFGNILPLNNSQTNMVDEKSLAGKVMWKGEIKYPYDVFEDEDFDTLQELWDLQVELNNLESFQTERPIDSRRADSPIETLLNENALYREYPNLLYSGAWSTWTKKMKGTDGKTHNFYEDLSGFISPEVFTSFLGGQSYDLRSIGMVYLRSLIAHVKFKITYNEKNFTNFQPESWQIVHVPVRSNFLDRTQSDNSAIYDKEAFAKTLPVKKMTHTEGHYEFDFYMYENQKRATDLDHIDYSGVKVSDLSPTDKKQIEGYYDRFYGEDLETVPGTSEEERALNKYWAITGFGYDRTKPDNSDSNERAKSDFRYAKRELELKYTGSVSNTDLRNSVIKNTVTEPGNNPYESKKYVYSEPKTTYVIIKGRLQLNPETGKVMNLAGDVVRDEDGHIQDLQPLEVPFVDGYADVTYTIHLGYAGQRDADGNYILDPYKDFNVFRNTSYVYNIHIEGINSILTSVMADVEVNSKIPAGDPDYEGKYRMKKQPGADGSVNLAMGKVYNLDAHYNQFNFMLTKSSLSDFYFEMHTPWNDYNSSDDIRADIQYFKDKYKDTWMTDYLTDLLYLNKYKNNPDFNWIKFTPTDDQRGMFDVDDNFLEREDGYIKNRKTKKYDRDNATMWNLFDFMVTMDALSEASAGIPAYDESGQAIKDRINNLLFGVTNPGPDIQETSLNLFECSVENPDGYHKTYYRKDKDALPFLLDIRTYELEDVVRNGEIVSALEQYREIRDNYNDSKLNVSDMNDPRWWYRYKEPLYDSATDRYLVKENYIAFLRDTDPVFQDLDLKDSQVIRRMFYTAYIDEYYYSEPPYGYSWSKPYWMQFVNMPARYINIGYRASDGSQTQDTQLSLDRQSSLMTTQLTMVQQSIQTFYSTTSNSVYALGLEHTNETHDPRWPDFKNEIVIPKDNVPSSKLSHEDGWLNAKRYVMLNNNAEWPHKMIEGKDTYYINDGGKDYSVWDYYVSDLVYEGFGDGIEKKYYNNITMRKRPGVKESDIIRDSRHDDTPIYYAGGIRMCMNRNRDENGNGKIDEDELKWFLPAADQMDIASLCHFSLQDPLFNYNQFYDLTVDNPEDNQRFPTNEIKSLYAKHHYKYHYLTSDYKISLTEELMNSSPYNHNMDNNFASNPYEMRCARNLNKEPYTDEGRPNNATPDNPQLVKVYTYRDAEHGSPEYDKFGKPIRTFTMDALDDRSIRDIIYHSRELPSPHYLFSSTNLPYKKFQVARDYEKLKTVLNENVGPVNSSARRFLKNIVDMTPCKYYYELEDGSDQGSWRAPNMAELGLMVMELRFLYPEYSDNVDDPVPDPDNPDNKHPLFLSVKGSGLYPYSATSWNFAGPWGRVLGIKQGQVGNLWDTYTSDPYKNLGTTDWSNHTGDYYPSQLPNNSFFIRCVKDLNVVGTNNRYPGATSETFK